MKKIIYMYDKAGVFDFTSRKIDGYEITQISVFRGDMPNLIMKLFRRMGNVFSYFTYDIWKYTVELYDYCVIPDVMLTKSVIKYLSSRPIAKKQIVYFWNIIGEKEIKLLNLAKENGFYIMTYNFADAKKYHILYNSQCWDKGYLTYIQSIGELEQDVYFLGYVKDRYNILCDIKEKLEKYKISAKFHMVSNANEPGTVNKPIQYVEYLAECNRSNAILDIVSESNKGLTLRPLEALFMKKKLITNYTDIKNYDFYIPYKKNIFILGEDDMNTLKSFVKSSFCEPEEIFDLDTYDIESWIKRFCI